MHSFFLFTHEQNHLKIIASIFPELAHPPKLAPKIYLTNYEIGTKRIHNHSANAVNRTRPFPTPSSQRAVGFGVRRQQREKGYPLRAAGANRTVAPGRSAPVTGRPRSGEVLPERAESGCPQKQQAKWYRGELQPGDRLSGLRLRVDAVCIQNEDGGFFHPLPPGACGF